jgi:DNA polymerase epsilon subunit 1
MVRALLSLGSSCALKTTTSGGLNRGLDRGFDLGDLEKAGSNVLRHKYLGGGAGLKYHFLFHATISSRHLIALFSPSGPVKVYVVDAARNRQQLPSPARWYEERVAKAETGSFAYPVALEFATVYYPTEGSAMRQLAKDLQTLKRGLNVIALCSPFEHSYYQAKAPIFSDFPFVTVKTGKEEEQSLMWLLQTSRRMINQYLRLSSWLATQIDIASHYDVPIGVSLSERLSLTAESRT